MAKIGIQEAIKKTGKSRAYLYKMMKIGGLSFTIGPDGHRQLDVAELLRAVGPFQSTVDSPQRSQKTFVDTPETAESFGMKAFTMLEIELKAAQEKLEQMERIHRIELDAKQLLLNAKEAHIQSLEKINDGLMQRLLENKSSAPAPVPQPVEPEQPSPPEEERNPVAELMKKLREKESKAVSKDTKKTGKKRRGKKD